FSLLALVLIGLPPLSGFLAKLSILTAILGPGSAEIGPKRTILAILLLLSGLVALIALSRIGIRTFWAPVEPLTPRITVMEAAPILIIMVMLVGLTAFAGPTMNLLLATADDLH